MGAGAGAGAGFGGGFALLVVLFILLIIIGCSWLRAVMVLLKSKLNSVIKGGFIHGWLRVWPGIRRLRIWWLWIRSRRVRFDYSIIYLVNYHWCSYLELKKAL